MIELSRGQYLYNCIDHVIKSVHIVIVQQYTPNGLLIDRLLPLVVLGLPESDQIVP